MPSDAVDWMTVPEAAQYLRVARATLYRWAKAGRIRLYRFGAGTTRVKRSDLDALGQPSGELTEEEAWSRLGLMSLWRDWDNPGDARYDNWREIYGVSEG